jgi:hypothetical protein
LEGALEKVADGVKAVGLGLFVEGFFGGEGDGEKQCVDELGCRQGVFAIEETFEFVDGDGMSAFCVRESLLVRRRLDVFDDVARRLRSSCRHDRLQAVVLLKKHYVLYNFLSDCEIHSVSVHHL